MNIWPLDDLPSMYAVLIFSALVSLICRSLLKRDLKRVGALPPLPWWRGRRRGEVLRLHRLYFPSSKVRIVNYGATILLILSVLAIRFGPHPFRAR